MARIVHIGVKVEDLDGASKFYQQVFGFAPTRTEKVRDHTSVHLSDGAIDFSLIQYESDESAEALASGRGPCIHHFGIEVDDVEQYKTEIRKYGCEIISGPGVIPVKFRAPGGTLAEIVPVSRYLKDKPLKSE